MTRGLDQYFDLAVNDEVLAEARAFNARLEKVLAPLPGIETVPAEVTRRSRREGKGVFPAPVFLDEAEDISVEGRAGAIPVRVLRPSAGPAKGVYIHIHGGGHSIGAHDMQDLALKAFADATGLVAASIGYRLAPENPYPAGPDDCEDATVRLVRSGAEILGAPPVFAIGGESAGANLAAATLVRLRDRHGLAGQIAGANLVYGGFDLTGSPSARLWARSLILSAANIRWFTENYTGHLPVEDRAAGDISPLYADLRGLPPAFFTVGMLDPLLDDSLFMAQRWRAAGGAAELAVYPEGVHAFNAFPIELARIANRRQHDFVRRAVREHSRQAAAAGAG